MYEGFYGLSRRPFSAAPNADAFVDLEPVQEALDAILNCVTQARGIAVITAPAGLGKTILCLQLAKLAAERFQSVFLASGAYSSGRAILQSLLYELDVEYDGLSEEEARLKLYDAAKSSAENNDGLLLIVDEAHRLSNPALEELRLLSDYAPQGEPLIRVVLSGQFELEEKLADPVLSSVNQRVGCQVCLEPLTLEQSSQLLTRRLLAAGGDDPGEILTPESLEAICRASDGNPRCLCQLADHSFLLAYAEEQRPVQRETVVAALNDLKELPLHWNDLLSSRFEPKTLETLDSDITDTAEGDSPMDVDPVGMEMPGYELDDTAFHDPPQPAEVAADDASTDESEIEFAVIEVGAGVEDPPALRDETSSDTDACIPVEAQMEQCPAEGCDTARGDIDPVAKGETAANDQASTLDAPIIDKYAALDRQLELPDELRTDAAPASANVTSTDAASTDTALTDAVQTKARIPEFHFTATPSAESTPLEPQVGAGEERLVLESIEDLRRDIESSVAAARLQVGARQMDHDFHEWLKLDVVEPEDETSAEESLRRSRLRFSTEPSHKGRQEASSPSASSANEPALSTVPEAPPQRFSQLFTRLRQRRQSIQRRERA